MALLKQFTQQYKLSKTLRFELKPCDANGSPITNTETVSDYKNQFLSEVVQNDKKRAEDYKAIKLIIDDYHRQHIEKSLSLPTKEKVLPLKGNKTLCGEDFKAAFTTFCLLKSDITEEMEEVWKKCQEDLRKKVGIALASDSNLFKKELITKSLPEFLKAKQADQSLTDTVESFAQFTTYFSGFHENRKNMYSIEEQATAIPYRTINENMAKFFINIGIYERVQNLFPELHTLLKEEADTEALSAIGVSDLDTLFTAESFIFLMSQKGINLFERIIGGYTSDKRDKVKGLKEHINDHTQSITHQLSESKKEKDKERAEELSKKLRNIKRCKFIHLFKQILSEKESSSYIPEGFESDQDLVTELSEFLTSFKNPLDKLSALLSSLFPSDPETLNHIYLKTDKLSDLSILLYENRALLPELVEAHRHALAYINFPTGKNGKVSAAVKKKRETFKIEIISLHKLNGLILDYYDSLDAEVRIKDKSSLQERLSNLVPLTNERIKQQSGNNLDETVRNLSDKLLSKKGLKISSDRRLPSEDQPQGGKGYQQIAMIKEPLDAILKMIRAMGHLHLVKSRKPIDTPNADLAFYSEFNQLFNELESDAFTLYNKTRNYLSKKPYKLDKFKLNFDSPTLLNGWAVNQEIPNSTILIRNKNYYYLGILNKENKKAFKVPKCDSSQFEKMYYHQVANPGMDVQNLMLIKGQTVKKNGRKDSDGVNRLLEHLKNEHLPEHINKIRISKTFSVASVNFNKQDLSDFIDFYKKRTIDYFSQFNFAFKESTEYRDFSEFTDHVNAQGYQLKFQPFSEDYLEQLISSNNLFLFQIYSKDFSSSSKGKPNLHTLYWKSLFDPRNLANVVTKLNGEAEMFFREKTLSKDKVAIHQAHKSVKNKNDNNPKKESLFEYDIIKDRRFTMDKFFFHVPISLNFKAPDVSQFNLHVNQLLVKEKQACFIGIDRGERNLLAYTVIDQNGLILEKGDINQIETDKGYKVDYHAKLEGKEKQRDLARKSWGEIENIKELKSGYLSHVIHKVAQLIEKYDAVVCLEDLNFGFKRGRFKVEKQVYQKFEKALIDKLNYLVFKDKDYGQPGHYLNAYQLTAPFESFQKLGKQSGILYYVTATHTSKICPATGFVNFLDLRYKSLGRAIEFFERIDSFSYNEEAHRFELTFDYSKMETFASRSPETGKQKWTLGTHGDLRYRNEKNELNKWVPKEINSTEQIAEILLDEAGIIAKNGENIAPQLITLKDSGFKNASGLFKKLFKELSTAFSLRHSKTGTSIDFILSPVVQDDGSYFDSRVSSLKLPINADENGAYHIALKGLWTLGQMRSSEKYLKSIPALKNEDWIPFAQKIAGKNNCP